MGMHFIIIRSKLVYRVLSRSLIFINTGYNTDIILVSSSLVSLLGIFFSSSI